MPPTIVTPSPSAQELEASNIGSSSGNLSNGIQFVPYNSKKTEFDEGRKKFRNFRMKNERNLQDPCDDQLRNPSQNKFQPRKSNRGVTEWNTNQQPKNRDIYPRRHSGSNIIKGRNLPPRLKKQQSGNANSDHHQPRRSYTNSRGENSRGESAYRSYRNENDYRRSANNSKKYEHSRETDNLNKDNARRESYVRGENFKRIYDSPHQTQNNAGPGFTFDPRLPQPNSIGMFAPKSMNDDWMSVPMNQLFDGYNHHKHGQQFTMNDFMAKKDEPEKKNEDHSSHIPSGMPQTPFSMEQMQSFMMGMCWMQQQMQQQNYSQMQAFRNAYHANLQQQQMMQSHSHDRLSQEQSQNSKKPTTNLAPPPGFSANDRDNLSDITNSTLPSELNECAVNEGMSSTAKKAPSNLSSALNNYPRNLHPNSPHYRKNSNIPNPFADKIYDSKLDFCIEKHDDNKNWSKNEPIGSKRSSGANKEDKTNTVKFYDFDKQTNLFGEKSLFDDKNCGVAPDFSFTDPAGDGSLNKLGNTNSSFVNNLESSNFSVFDQSKQSSDVSGMKTTSAFGNDLRTSGYLTNDCSKNMSLLLNDSEPRIGEEFNIREVHENNQTIRLQRVFGEFYCRECDRAWASQNVWVIEGTKKVYVKRTCNQCHKITEPWYTNPSNKK